MLSDWQVPGQSVPRRPATVSVASLLFLAVAGLSVAESLLALRDYFAGMQAYAETVESRSEGFTSAGIALQFILCGGKIMAATLFAVLAVLNAKGHAWSRNTTFGVASPWLLCCAAPCGAGSASKTSFLNRTAESDATSRRMAELLPGWHTPAMHATEVLIPTLTLTVLILLLLPASANFFRRPQQVPLQYHPEWTGMPQWSAGSPPPGAQPSAGSPPPVEP